MDTCTYFHMGRQMRIMFFFTFGAFLHDLFHSGIKYLTVMREPDAPLSAQVRRELLLSVLPSLNPPEHADIKSVQLKDGNQSQEPYPSATAERPLKSCDVLPRYTLYCMSTGSELFKWEKSDSNKQINTED